MKHLYLFEEFIGEKKPNVKKNVKKIAKKINTQLTKSQKEAGNAKELSDSPEVKDKMKATLSKMKSTLANIEAEKQKVKMQIEIKKGQIRTAKSKDAASDDLEKKAKETKKEEADK